MLLFCPNTACPKSDVVIEVRGLPRATPFNCDDCGAPLGDCDHQVAVPPYDHLIGRSRKRARRRHEAHIAAGREA